MEPATKRRGSNYPVYSIQTIGAEAFSLRLHDYYDINYNIKKAIKALSALIAFMVLLALTALKNLSFLKHAYQVCHSDRIDRDKSAKQNPVHLCIYEPG
jgi:hypothetical protein